MNFIKSPNRWSCLPASFAMVLGVSLQEVVVWVGTDGSTIEWPELPEPKRRRGFHIQEMIDFAWIMKFSVTPFQAKPTIQSDPSVEIKTVQTIRSSELRVLHALQHNAVVTGETAGGVGHAVAWDGERSQVYDPGNRILRIEDFLIDTVWVVRKIKSRE